MNTLRRRLGRVEQATGLNHPGFCVLVLPSGISPDEKDRAVARALGREPMRVDYVLIISGIGERAEFRA